MKAAVALACGLLLSLAAKAQILDEVPFVVSPDNVTLAMLEAARVGPEDYVIDLGSGDGRIVILAAKRFGARGLGVELVADLVRQSRENAKRAGVAERAEFREEDLFQTDLSPATVVTLYLLPEVNIALRPKLLALKPGTRIVSHDWDLGEWKPDRTIVLEVPDKPVGLEKRSRVHLWVVPAKVAGLWCGTAGAAGARLHIEQDYQRFVARVEGATTPRTIRGDIEGANLKAGRAQAPTLAMRLDGNHLRVTSAAGSYAPWRQAAFERRLDGTCPEGHN